MMIAKELGAAAAALLVVGTTCCMSARSAEHPSRNGSCEWSVVRTRSIRSGEAPFEESLRYAPRGMQRNEVQGPDSLQLAVRTTKGYYPHVFLEDLRTGHSNVLLPGGWSNLPSWSPDGKQIAFVIRDSVSKRQSLAVVNRRAAKTTTFTAASSVIDYKWSPDGSALAAYGHSRATRQVTLYWLRTADGVSQPVDTLDLLADYDFSWSPDSKQLVFSRTTESSTHEVALAADLWVTSSEGRRKCRLLETPDQVELRPRWITNRVVSFESAPVREGVVGEARTVAAELRLNTDR